MKGPFRNKQGSSLLEIVVAIAVLGLMVAPVCSSLVLSFRLNAESEKILQARLLVESTVEQLMAEGIYEDKIDTDRNYILDNKDESDSDEEEPKVIITVGEYEEDALWYAISVGVEGMDNVEVSTVVRAAAANNKGGEGS